MRFSISTLFALVGAMGLLCGSYAAVGFDGVVGCLLACGAGGFVIGVRRRSRKLQAAALATFLPALGWFAIPYAIESWEVAVLKRNLADAKQDVRAAAFAEPIERRVDVSPDLVRYLENSDETLREFASHALIRLSPYNRDSLAPLVAALSDDSAAVRRNAVEGVGRRLKFAGDQARQSRSPAIAGLIQATNDSSGKVRFAASAALVMYLGDRYHAHAVPGLTEGLASTINRRRSSAVHLLGEIGPAARAALPALTKALHDNDQNVRWAAATAIGNLGPAAAQAYERIEHADVTPTSE